MPHVDELVHDQHDPILVVSLASGDLAATDRDHDTAQSLISSCSDCARLHDDVLAIARATQALPPVQRPRDFRLTDADAAKLRPAGWRRLLGGLANGPLLSRQLGAGLATLGVAGLLLTALPGIPLGMMGSAAASSAPSQAAAAAAEAPPAYESLQSQDDAALVAPAPAASLPIDTMGGGEPSRLPGVFNLDSGSGSPAPVAGNRNATGATAHPVPVAENPNVGDSTVVAPATVDQASNDGPSTIAIVSTVLLVAGLLLLLVRRFARGSPAA